MKTRYVNLTIELEVPDDWSDDAAAEGFAGSVPDDWWEDPDTYTDGHWAGFRLVGVLR